MIAAYAASFDPSEPLNGLVVGERPAPTPREGWTVVDVRAAALNHHDLWSLRGVGLRAEQLPMILGTDAAGVTADGREVVVHGVIQRSRRAPLACCPSATTAPSPSRSRCRRRTSSTSPSQLAFVEAACLPTAWLTAYRMLFVTGRATPGQRVLVQGAGGGLATAAILLGNAAGLEVIVTGRDE